MKNEELTPTIILYKILIEGITELTLKLIKKVRNLEFDITLNNEVQKKALETYKFKATKKDKPVLEFDNFEIAQEFLAVLNRNYILRTGNTLNVVDKVSEKDL